MKNTILPAMRLTLLCFVCFCGIYSITVWAIAQLAPGQGKGITLTKNGKTHYVNVGQSFTSDNYFWSRPSAVDYNAAGSGGSNKGPSNPDYLAQVQARIDTLLVHNPDIKKQDIPTDLVTASGSGLDPHISIDAARIQIPRISRIRHISEMKLTALINTSIEGPLWGILGTPTINVLKLNISLDSLSHHL